MVERENNQEFPESYNHLPWKSFFIDANISLGKRRPHPIVTDDVLTIMLYFNTLLFNWKKIKSFLTLIQKGEQNEDTCGL